MSSQPVKLILGGASFGPAPDSEDYPGQAGAAGRFSIDTKYLGGFAPTPSSKEGLIASADESLNALKTEQVNVYYIHAPDRRVPLQDILAGADAVYKNRKLRRLTSAGPRGTSCGSLVGLSSGGPCSGYKNSISTQLARGGIMPWVAGDQVISHAGKAPPILSKPRTELLPRMSHH
ncbi:hypothetical protein ASPCAL13574 [Aspergillus calidoustus]|uniref:NADP-dependent oxidoreductase domain-containing protein n=1 Tax=Aspergillus calidoustus TaxID=454130 RepID=A0A0U5GGG7_ASPCI|nr:hypothetical protein ASPCAL13574 [Aspergillus calidoustus]